jgi:hypothetical protein
MNQELKEKTFQIYCQLLTDVQFRSFQDDPEYLVAQAKLMALAFINEWKRTEK